MRALKIIAASVGAVVGIAVVVVLVLAATPWGNERVRRIVVSQVNSRLNGELTIGRLGGNLFSGAALFDVSLVDSTRRPVFTARHVVVHYSLAAALRRRVDLQSLELDTAVITMDKRPGAAWNFQTLVRPSSTPKDTTRKSSPPELANITIHHGRFYYRRPWAPDSTLSSEKREAAIASALSDSTRRRVERVPGGFQRVLDYHDIDARLPTVRIATGTQPTSVEIAALSMLAEPYRPPAIDVRSLIGTLLVSKDSLWWRGAHMVMPGSKVSGDGTIGFHKSGFLLDLTGAPVALADLQWLDPKLPSDGGGDVRYRMEFHGDTADFSIDNANLRYGVATLVGHAAVARVVEGKRPPQLLLRGADLTVAHLSTAAIHQFAPSLHLKRSGVIDGHVVASGTLLETTLDADVRFDDAAAGRSRVVAKGGVGFDGGLRAKDLSVQLLPAQLATVAGFGVHMPVGGVVTGNALLNGTVRDGGTAKADVTHVEHGDRSHIQGNGSYLTAGKRITADVTLEPVSLNTVGRFVPSAQLTGDVSGRIHATGTPSDLRLSGTLHSVTGGKIDGGGIVQLAGTHSRYDVRFVLDALNAGVFSRRAPATQLTGTISARGAGTVLASANAVVAADLVHARYDTFTVERVLARLALADGLLRVDSLQAFESGVAASASGTLGLTAARSGSLRFDARVDSLGALRRWIGTSDSAVVAVAEGRQSARLAAARADSARRAEAVRIEQIALGLPMGVSLVVDTLTGVRHDSLAGTLRVLGILTGNIRELGLDATVRGSGLVVRGNSVNQFNGTVSSRDVLDRKTPLTFRAQADTVDADGFAFRQVSASGNWRDSAVTADLRVQQDSLVSYAASGRYSHSSGGLQDIRVDSLRMQFDTLVWRLAHPGAVRLRTGDVNVDSIDLRSSVGGRLYANGAIPKTGDVHLDVIVEGVRVSTILMASQRSAAGDGNIGASAQLTGTRADPAFTGHLALRDATYQGIRAPDADADIRFLQQRLIANVTATDSNGKRVLIANAALPLDLSNECVTGSRRIAGPLIADVVLDTLNLAALPLPSRTITDVRGVVAANAHVRGSWAKPEYSGNLALRNGALVLVSTEMKIDGAIADAHISGDSIILDSILARARGPIRANGSVDLSNSSNPFVRISASGENVRVFDATRGLVDVNASIEAIGPLDALRVTGHGEMLDGFLALKQFRKDLLRVKPPGDLSFFTVFDTSAPPGDRARVLAERAQHKRVAIIADLTMAVDRGSYYRNRPDANTEFFTEDGEEVRAHLDQRSSDQWAVGFVRIGGGVAFFRARAFTPERGALTFIPHTDAGGLLQQVGERIVWEPGRGLFATQLLTGGTSKAPAVGMESGTLFPMRGRELSSYLTMGRLTTSLLQQSGSSLSGSEAWSGQLSGETGALAHRQQAATALGVVLHDIGTGATKAFGLDAFGVSPADVPTELVYGKTGGVRGALVEGGRYLTTDRYVAAQLRLTTGIPGLRMSQDFGSAYRLDLGIEPRFLFREPEELGITHPTDRTGAFGAFLTRMWEF